MSGDGCLIGSFGPAVVRHFQEERRSGQRQADAQDEEGAGEVLQCQIVFLAA